MVFDKGAKTSHWEKDTLFKKMVLENWISTCKKKKKMKLDPYHTTCTKINSK